jgi:HAD superfamily 5'-nucleotidase-like hydrolase
MTAPDASRAPAPHAGPALHPRGVFCNRTLNFRSIRAVGYDLDYTLVHYNVAAWEERAYDHSRDNLVKRGWPIAGLRFDREMVERGLVIDKELGNIVKANRFGFVKKAVHGTTPLDFEAQRTAYTRTQVDLSEERWVFLNTLFSLSEGCLYAQLTELLDRGVLPGPLGYRELYERVRDSLDATHVEGELKAEVLAEPSRFVEDDAETALTLLDQKHAGEKLLLITNSEWSYADAMMKRAVERFLPPGLPWRDLFHLVIVGARKPDFFTSRAPAFEVVTDNGLLRPDTRALLPGKVYFGGNAGLVERALGVSGDEILYVGDHMFGDVHVSKRALRWRTALVLRELEEEIKALGEFRRTEGRLSAVMEEKERVEAEAAQTRLRLQRKRKGYGPPLGADDASEKALEAALDELRQRVAALDAVIGPMAQLSGELANRRWGLLLRAGNDKSHLARQVERYADVYTSRVSNLLAATPFVYLRSPRGSLPHDPAVIPEDPSVTPP